MSTTPNEPRGGLIAERIQHELVHLQTNWLWFMLLGALLILCGMVAIVYPFVAAVGVIVILAATLLIGGVAIIISSFWAGKWKRLPAAAADRNPVRGGRDVAGG